MKSKKYYFVGFSTQQSKIVKNIKLYDLNLIIQDLQNQFNTRRGERIRRPTYGSIIWDMVFEPLNEGNKQLIVNDCSRIVNSDPRVTLRDISVSELDYGYSVNITLYYAPQDITATFTQSFENRQNDQTMDS